MACGVVSLVVTVCDVELDPAPCAVVVWADVVVWDVVVEFDGFLLLPHPVSAVSARQSERTRIAVLFIWKSP